MKNVPFTASVVGVLILLAGCASDGAEKPEKTDQAAPAASTKFVLMDPGAQHSVATDGLQERVLEDGRLEVAALVRNTENRRIQVQIQCVFKDAAGFSTGDETPWQNLILTENGQETVRFQSMNAAAKTYTVRVRQAR